PAARRGARRARPAARRARARSPGRGRARSPRARARPPRARSARRSTRTRRPARPTTTASAGSRRALLPAVLGHAHPELAQVQERVVLEQHDDALALEAVDRHARVADQEAARHAGVARAGEELRAPAPVRAVGL